MTLAATRATRLLLAATLALAGLVALAGVASAAPPSAQQDRQAQAKPVKPPVAPRGYDVSYPQCSATLPSNPAFAIVGVNGGRVDKVNPCLASQIAWGGGTAAELYANTGNPGPAISMQWPVGQTTPRVCAAANPDTADCAFDYGWNAAKLSFETAQAAYQQLGISTSPALTPWWLDVETTNTWRSDNLAMNIAALEGEVAYLRDTGGVTRLGFYSTTYQWGVITGGTTAFAAYPSWGAGSSSERAARSLCDSTTTSFTGGPLVLVQYPYAGLDADLRC